MFPRRVEREGSSDFSLNIVGERYDNADGSSRQAEIRRSEPGEDVELRREPTNRHDPSAVAVYSCRGVQVGYVGADRTAWIGSKIDKGMDVRAAVERVVGNLRGPSPCRLVIKINLFGQQPDIR